VVVAVVVVVMAAAHVANATNLRLIANHLG